MISNAERGKAFQIVCRDALLSQRYGCDFESDVPIDIGGVKFQKIDLARRSGT